MHRVTHEESEIVRSRILSVKRIKIFIHELSPFTEEINTGNQSINYSISDHGIIKINIPKRAVYSLIMLYS